MSNKKSEIDTFTILSAKDPEYPCQYCAKKQNEKCGFTCCTKWMNWFGREWRRIRRTFSRGDIVIEPVQLHRGRNKQITKTPIGEAAKRRKEK